MMAGSMQVACKVSTVVSMFACFPTDMYMNQSGLVFAGGVVSAKEPQAQEALRRFMLTGIAKIFFKISWSPSQAE